MLCFFLRSWKYAFIGKCDTCRCNLHIRLPVFDPCPWSRCLFLKFFSVEMLQDFEIAGSQTGVASVADCESPAVTVRSWDSHANYRVPGSHPGSIFHGVILYCDETHLKSSTGVVRVLLVVCFPQSCPRDFV